LRNTDVVCVIITDWSSLLEYKKTRLFNQRSVCRLSHRYGALHGKTYSILIKIKLISSIPTILQLKGQTETANIRQERCCHLANTD